MSDEQSDTHKRARMVQIVRLVVSRREQAPRSPRMERALKRLIWRYHRELRVSNDQGTLKQQGSEHQNESQTYRP